MQVPSFDLTPGNTIAYPYCIFVFPFVLSSLMERGLVVHRLMVILIAGIVAIKTRQIIS